MKKVGDKTLLIWRNKATRGTLNLENHSDAFTLGVTHCKLKPMGRLSG
jgi:hypothetical protein